MQILLLVLLFPIYLFSTIEQVSFLFAGGFCQDSCQTELQKKLAAVPEVASVTVNGSSAVMAWKPNKRFSYGPLKTAMQMVGVQRKNMRIIVTGSVQKRGNAWYLTSSGDYSQFRLVGLLISSTTEYVVPYAIENHPITDDRKTFLEEAVKDRSQIRVSGALLSPETLSPTVIIMEDYKKVPSNKKAG